MSEKSPLETLQHDKAGLMKRIDDKRGALKVHREETVKETSALYNQVFELSSEKEAPNFALLGHNAIQVRLYRTAAELAEGEMVEEIHNMVEELNRLEQRIVFLEAGYDLDKITECEKWVEVVGSTSAASDRGDTYITLVNHMIQDLIENNNESRYVQMAYLVIKEFSGAKQLDWVLASSDHPKHGTTLLGIRLTPAYRLMLKESGSVPLDNREILGAIIWYLNHFIEIQQIRRTAVEHPYETEASRMVAARV